MRVKVADVGLFSFADYERRVEQHPFFHDVGGVPLPTLYDSGGRFGAGGPGGATPIHARYGIPGAGPGARAGFYGGSGGGGTGYGHQVLSPQQHQALQSRLYGGPQRGLGDLGGGGRGGGFGGGGPPMRMGAIEFLLYNMAAMLAGVAAGYDVRISNVSPVHPRLLPRR